MGNEKFMMGIKSNIKTVLGWLNLQNPQAEKIALDLGLIQGQKQYTKFIILGRSRTGSNFLRGLLNDHSNIVTMGEIFRNKNEIDWDSHYYQSNNSILKQYQTDPVKFLYKTVFRKFRPNVKAVGFKLFYYHAQNIPFNGIWNALKDDKSIHVLHIKRENILRTHLSRIQAEQSGSWVNTTGNLEKHKPVTINPHNCLKDFEQTRKWETDADLFFQDHPLLQISYEQLSENYGSVLKDIQQFLCLPDQPVIPRTFKQSKLSLSLAIENYWTLKEYFINTPWAVFFEE
jgi:LPS sulfotransferase NodH